MKGKNPNAKGSFQKPSQADESAVRDIRRLQVFPAKDPRLHSKNRDALAMRDGIQNRQKRRKLLGPAQYRGEDAVYVLLANILEEETRMQAYTGKKKPPLMTPEDLQKHIGKLSLVKNMVRDNFSLHHPDSGGVSMISKRYAKASNPAGRRI